MAAFLRRMTAVLALAACQSSTATTAAPDAAEAEGTQTRFDIPAVTVVIAHDRPDLVLEKLMIQLYCLPREGGQGGAPFETCGTVTVDGPQPTDQLFELPATGRDRVDTKPISIGFATRAENVWCIGMKVLFQGIPNQTDSLLYVDLDDRYSILSYCSEATLPPQHAQQSRWAHRRAPTFQEFVTRLGQPIAIALKPKT